MANHDRRLDRLENALAPKGRTVFIWYWEGRHPLDHVEREKARLIEAGELGPHDKLIVSCWERTQEAA